MLLLVEPWSALLVRPPWAMSCCGMQALNGSLDLTCQRLSNMLFWSARMKTFVFAQHQRETCWSFWRKSERAVATCQAAAAFRPKDSSHCLSWNSEASYSWSVTLIVSLFPRHFLFHRSNKNSETVWPGNSKCLQLAEAGWLSKTLFVETTGSPISITGVFMRIDSNDDHFRGFPIGANISEATFLRIEGDSPAPLLCRQVLGLIGNGIPQKGPEKLGKLVRSLWI